jgi:hypothetical protein
MHAACLRSQNIMRQTWQSKSSQQIFVIFVRTYALPDMRFQYWKQNQIICIRTPAWRWASKTRQTMTKLRSPAYRKRIRVNQAAIHKIMNELQTYWRQGPQCIHTHTRIEQWSCCRECEHLGRANLPTSAQSNNNNDIEVNRPFVSNHKHALTLIDERRLQLYQPAEGVFHQGRQGDHQVWAVHLVVPAPLNVNRMWTNNSLQLAKLWLRNAMCSQRHASRYNHICTLHTCAMDMQTDGTRNDRFADGAFGTCTNIIIFDEQKSHDACLCCTAKFAMNKDSTLVKLRFAFDMNSRIQHFWMKDKSYWLCSRITHLHHDEHAGQ